MLDDDEEEYQHLPNGEMNETTGEAGGGSGSGGSEESIIAHGEADEQEDDANDEQSAVQHNPPMLSLYWLLDAATKNRDSWSAETFERFNAIQFVEDFCEFAGAFKRCIDESKLPFVAGYGQVTLDNLSDATKKCKCFGRRKKCGVDVVEFRKYLIAEEENECVQEVGGEQEQAE